MRNNPIIALIDMDCFFVQVELRSAPQYIGKEAAVVQYNTWRGGGVIAVSYEARAKGVTRSMRGDEASRVCPGLHLFRVQETRGKADLSKYRAASGEVITCLGKHAGRVEKASIDEAFIDLTDEVDNLLVAAPDSEELKQFWDKSNHHFTGCHAVGFKSYSDWLDHIYGLRIGEEYCDDIRLAVGAFLVQKMRDDIYQTLGFRCSAGIAHTKVVAKYACGVNKPNQQTIVPMEYVSDLLRNARIVKIRNLGGKMGSYIQDQLNVTTMGELMQFSLEELVEKFGEKTGQWLYNLCRGQDDESVLSRQLAQSISCSKTFPGNNQLNKVERVRYWIDQMAQEIAERIQEDCSKNSRLPTHMNVSYRQLRADCDEGSRRSYSGSRVVPLGELTATAISSAAFSAMSCFNTAEHHDLDTDAWFPPLVSLGISTGKFRPQLAPNDISRFLIEVPADKFNSNKVTPNINSNKEPEITESVNSPPEANRSNFISISEQPQLKIDPHQPQSCQQEDSNQSLDGPPKKKGFFARLREEEMKKRKESQEKFETRMIPETPKASVTELDYILCDQCSKNILMWEAPEHFDWHLARDLQKQLSKEIYEEEARIREAKLKQNGTLKNNNNKANGKASLSGTKANNKRKINDKVPIKSNQLTIDQFYKK